MKCACNANATYNDDDDIDGTTVGFGGTTVDDDDNEWTTQRSKRKKKGQKVTFGSSCGGGTTNSKFATNLQALEKAKHSIPPGQLMPLRSIRQILSPALVDKQRLQRK